MDSQNFNAYILQKLGCSPAECERRIKGKNVPIMVIHALVQLRETYNTVSHCCLRPRKTRFSLKYVGENIGKLSSITPEPLKCVC